MKRGERSAEARVSLWQTMQRKDFRLWRWMKAMSFSTNLCQKCFQKTLSGEGEEPQTNVKWKQVVGKTASQRTMWKMMEKEPYLFRMWERFSSERSKAKKVRQLADGEKQNGPSIRHKRPSIWHRKIKQERWALCKKSCSGALTTCGPSSHQSTSGDNQAGFWSRKRVKVLSWRRSSKRMRHFWTCMQTSSVRWNCWRNSKRMETVSHRTSWRTSAREAEKSHGRLAGLQGG